MRVSIHSKYTLGQYHRLPGGLLYPGTINGQYLPVGSRFRERREWLRGAIPSEVDPSEVDATGQSGPETSRKGDQALRRACAAS